MKQRHKTQEKRPSLSQLCDLLQSSAIEPASPRPHPRLRGHVQMIPTVNFVLCDPKRQFAQLETHRNGKTARIRDMCKAMLLTQCAKPQKPRPFKLRHLSQDILRTQRNMQLPKLSAKTTKYTTRSAYSALLTWEPPLLHCAFPVKLCPNFWPQISSIQKWIAKQRTLPLQNGILLPRRKIRNIVVSRHTTNPRKDMQPRDVRPHLMNQTAMIKRTGGPLPCATLCSSIITVDDHLPSCL